MRLQHKSFPVTEIKTADEEQGLLEAVVSVFGIEDLGGDRVLPGAFSESLARRKPYGCVFHDWQRVVAKTLDAKELPPGDPLLPESIRQYGGLYVKAQFNRETQDGRETWSNLRQGLLDQFSIGYSVDPGGSRSTKEGVTELSKLTLYEWSPVLWGMNPATAPLSMKSLETKAIYLGEYAAEEMTLAALRDCCDSLFYRAIYNILFDYDGSRSADEKVEMIDAAIAEFHQLAVTCLRAMLTAAEGDDGEMEAEYKQVFSVPARATGRLSEQLAAVLVAGGDVVDRLTKILPLRQQDGRDFPPERWGQVQALHALTEALLSARVTEAKTDTSLLQLQAQVEAERLKLLLACGGV